MPYRWFSFPGTRGGCAQPPLVRGELSRVGAIGGCVQAGPWFLLPPCVGQAAERRELVPCTSEHVPFTDSKAAIRDAFSVDETFQDELKPSWNVAPMQGIPFVSEQLREGELVRRLEIARWGSSPSGQRTRRPELG